MKKLLRSHVVLLTLFIFALACVTLLFAVNAYSPTAHASGDPLTFSLLKPKVDAGEGDSNVISVIRGKSFDVDVVIKNNADDPSDPFYLDTHGFSSIVLDVTYNIEAMCFDSFRKSSNFFSVNVISSGLNGVDGKRVQPLRFVIENKDNVLGEGIIITLRFKSTITDSVDPSDPEDPDTWFDINLSHDYNNTYVNMYDVPTHRDDIYAPVVTTGAKVIIAEGDFQCLYYDEDGTLIRGYEEASAAAFKPEDPDVSCTNVKYVADDYINTVTYLNSSYQEIVYDVYHCDCSPLANLRSKVGNFTDFCSHTPSPLGSTTETGLYVTAFDTLSSLFNSYISGLTVSGASNTAYTLTQNEEFAAFFQQAQKLFDYSKSERSKNLSYTASSGAILGITGNYVLLGNGNGTEKKKNYLTALSRLFGYSYYDVVSYYEGQSFLYNLQNMVSVFTSAEMTLTDLGRLKFDGAIYTEDHSFILPYLFRCQKTEYTLVNNVQVPHTVEQEPLLVYLIIDEQGKVSAWVSDAEKLLDYTTSNGYTFDSYGRCLLFGSGRDADRMYQYSFYDWKCTAIGESGVSIVWDELTPEQKEEYSATGFKYRMDALYTTVNQPYTVTVHFGLKNYQTGVITYGNSGDSAEYTNNYTYDAEIGFETIQKRDYYSYFIWFSDAECTHKLPNYLVPVDNDPSHDLEHLSYDVYGYRILNEAGAGNTVSAESLTSHLVNKVEVDGLTVTLKTFLAETQGVRDMGFILSYPNEIMKIVGYEWDHTFFEGDAFSFNSPVVEPANRSKQYNFSWSYVATGDDGKFLNCNRYGLMLTLTFVLDADAENAALLREGILDGSYEFTYRTLSKESNRKIFTMAELGFDSDTDSSPLWYTELNVTPDYLTIYGVTPPTPQAEPYVYDGTLKTYVFQTNVDAAHYFIKVCESKVDYVSETNHGNYDFKVSLKRYVGEALDSTYRYWNVTDTESVYYEYNKTRVDLPYCLIIKPRPITLPDIDVSDRYYDDGHEIVFTSVVDNYYYAFTTDSVKSATDVLLDGEGNVISYKATVYLLHKGGNTYWKDINVDDDQVYHFMVLKKKVAIPDPHDYNAENGKYIFDNSEKTYTFADDGGSNYYTPSNTKRTNYVSSEDPLYYVVCTLNDPNNYEWEDGTITNKSDDYPFIIEKRPVAIPTESTRIYKYSPLQEQKYIFDDEGDTAYYIVRKDANGKLTTLRTDAGTQDVVFGLKYPENTYWAGTDEATADYSYPFKIYKKGVDRPTEKVNNFVFDNTEKVYTFSALGSVSTYHFEDEDGNTFAYGSSLFKMTHSGTKKIYIVLNNTDNYCWQTAGDDTSFLDELVAKEYYVFTVAKRAITVPVKSVPAGGYIFSPNGGTFAFTGTEDLNDYYGFSTAYTVAEGYALDGTVCAYRNVNDYVVTATLKYKEDTYWADEGSTITDKTYNFTVLPLQIPEPSQSYIDGYLQTDFDYSPNTIVEFKLGDAVTKDYKQYVVISNNKQTDAGNYDAYASLNEDYAGNIEWKDGTTDPKAYHFVINQATRGVPTLKCNGIETAEREFCAEEIVFTLNVSDDKLGYYEIVENTNKAFHVGNYAVKVKLADPKNYRWANKDKLAVDRSDPIDLPFTISPVKISRPAEAKVTSFVYNGTPHTYEFNTDLTAELYTKYVTVSDTMTYTNAGHYVVTVSLNRFKTTEESEYTYYDVVWRADDTHSTETHDDETYDWIISPILLKPSVKSAAEWNGTNIKPAVNNVDDYLGEGIFKIECGTELAAYNTFAGWSDPGDYFVRLTLLSDNYGNYVWNEPTEDDPTKCDLSFTISTAYITWNVEPSASGWTYDGTTHALASFVNYSFVNETGEDVTDSVTVTVSFKTGTASYSSELEAYPLNAGTYQVKFQVIEYPEKYTFGGAQIKFDSLTIDKLVVDMSGVAWDYTTFNYDGNEKTVSLTGIPVLDIEGQAITPSYVGGSNKATDAGDYISSVTLVYDKSNIALDFGEGSMPSMHNWTINKKKVSILWEEVANHEFVNYSTTFASPRAYYNGVGTNEKYYLDVEITTGQSVFCASGSYTFACATMPNGNYVAIDAAVTEKTVVVSKRAVTAPVEHDYDAPNGTYTFDPDGSSQIYTFKTYDALQTYYYTKSGGNETLRGTHAVVVALVYPDDTYWADSEANEYDASDRSYDFVILPYVVTAPVMRTAPYTFDTMQKSAFVSLGDSAHYSVSGTILSVNAISEDITVALPDVTNYVWSTGSTDPIVSTFTILRRAITKPSLEKTTYVFDGSAKVFSFKNNDSTSSNYYSYDATKLTETYRGDYSVEVYLTDTLNTYWADSPENTFVTDNVTFNYTITPFVVTAPEAHDDIAAPYIYNGSAQTYTFKTAGSTGYYSVDDPLTLVRTASGSQKISLSLPDQNNYVWSDGSVASKTDYTFTIKMRAIVAPYFETESYVYNGTERVFTLAEDADSKAFYGYDASLLTQTNAKDYTLTVSLAAPNDTYWADSEELDQAARKLSYSIKKAVVTKPIAHDDENEPYVYNGNLQEYSFSFVGDSDLYNVSTDELTKVNAGDTTFYVTLKDAENYRWAAGDSSALQFTFSIAKKKIAKPSPRTTEYQCTDAVQVFDLPTGEGYVISNNERKEQGEQEVTVSLLNENYVWVDGSETALTFTFRIEHNFTKTLAEEKYFAESASCEHGAYYYYACACGEKSSDLKWEYGNASGHAYEVTFEWDEEKHTAIAHVVCNNDPSHNKDMDADVSLRQIAPGVSYGYNIYTASVDLHYDYIAHNEVFEEKIDPIGHNFELVEWIWEMTSDGFDATAVFQCTDTGYSSLVESIKADNVTIENVDAIQYAYVASVVFHEVVYSDSYIMTKPRLIFELDGGISAGQVRLDDIYVLPYTDVTSLFPQVPTKNGATFLKWLSDGAVSIFYSEANGKYMDFTIGRSDVEFKAVWESYGSITVDVQDLYGNPFSECEVIIKQGDAELSRKAVNVNGVATFSVKNGNYTIIVQYTVNKEVIYTTGKVITGDTTVPVVFTAQRFNTELDAQDVEVSVENLENALPEEERTVNVTPKNEGDVAEVKVTLKVKNELNPEKIALITDFVKDSESVAQCTDVSLVKTIVRIDAEGKEYAKDTDLTSSEGIIDIVFSITDELYQKLADVHGNVENIIVARCDVNGVDYLTKLSKSDAMGTSEDCFYVTMEDDVPVIVVRTKMFDGTTYGLCVSSDSVLSDNSIQLTVTDWTYGEQSILPVATASHGTPVIKYEVNGVWVSELPTNAGTYNVRAYVAEGDGYKYVEAWDTLVIAKATVDLSKISFKDMTVLYDGDAHSILIEGELPAGVKVRYDGNSKVDIGEYTVTVAFIVDERNYIVPDQMTAKLYIVTEEEVYCCCWIFWLLLGIGIAELAILLFLTLKGKKEKKEDDNSAGVACCISLCTLGKGACLAVLLSMAAVDIALLAVIILKLLKRKK